MLSHAGTLRITSRLEPWAQDRLALLKPLQQRWTVEDLDVATPWPTALRAGWAPASTSSARLLVVRGTRVDRSPTVRETETLRPRSVGPRDIAEMLAPITAELRPSDAARKGPLTPALIHAAPTTLTSDSQAVASPFAEHTNGATDSAPPSLTVSPPAAGRSRERNEAGADSTPVTDHSDAAAVSSTLPLAPMTPVVSQAPVSFLAPMTSLPIKPPSRATSDSQAVASGMATIRPGMATTPGPSAASRVIPGGVAALPVAPGRNSATTESVVTVSSLAPSPVVVEPQSLPTPTQRDTSSSDKPVLRQTVLSTAGASHLPDEPSGDGLARTAGEFPIVEQRSGARPIAPDVATQSSAAGHGSATRIVPQPEVPPSTTWERALRRVSRSRAAADAPAAPPSIDANVGRAEPAQEHPRSTLPVADGVSSDEFPSPMLPDRPELYEFMRRLHVEQLHHSDRQAASTIRPRPALAARDGPANSPGSLPAGSRAVRVDRLVPEVPASPALPSVAAVRGVTPDGAVAAGGAARSVHVAESPLQIDDVGPAPGLHVATQVRELPRRQKGEKAASSRGGLLLHAADQPHADSATLPAWQLDSQRPGVRNTALPLAWQTASSSGARAGSESPNPNRQTRISSGQLPTAIATATDGTAPPIPVLERQQQAEPDLDALVETVFRKLTRRLAVERERRGLPTWS